MLIRDEEYQSMGKAMGAYAKLQEHIFVLYQRLFPNYAWVDATSAVCVMHGEIERLREAAEERIRHATLAEQSVAEWRSE